MPSKEYWPEDLQGKTVRIAELSDVGGLILVCEEDGVEIDNCVNFTVYTEPQQRIVCHTASLQLKARIELGFFNKDSSLFYSDFAHCKVVVK